MGWHFLSLMKLRVFGLIPAALSLASCGTFSDPHSSSGTFDSLRAPGSRLNDTDTRYSREIYPGQFISTNIPNTAFFKNKPKDGEDADKLLNVGTNMKIVSDDGSYVRVELDNGEVGWVPSVMVSSSSSNLAPIDGAYQPYPPLPDGDGIETFPPLNKAGEPSGGTIPTIIDPNAPIPDSTPSAPKAAP